MNLADVVMRLLEVLMLFLAVLLFLPLAINFIKGFAPKDDWPDDGEDRRGER
jgi:hypothetical protein